ncbi:MAG: family 10 glycosylhydrolase [Dermabacter sp.]|nr:family 10 glycosylhydrolase [Dermabacter sp.]
MTHLTRRQALHLGSATAGGAFVAGITAPASAVGPTPDLPPNPETLPAAPSPKVREFRALWIASVVNIDYPSSPTLSADALREEFRAWLDLAVSLNLNAVISQVRPTADAFWPSPIEPWSQYLTGTQGRDPGFDVLAFQIEEAHKRNLEFHAWFNPYRVSMSENLDHLVPNHPARTHGWTFPYGGKTYYNPGIPEVRRLSEDAMLHAVEHYDIDAVHFDDYFYPYPVAGADYPDRATFEQYGAPGQSIEDWRRENISTLVREMHERIRALKPWVKFGISPFGIWRNASADPLGSATSGSQSYDIIAADTRRWVKEQWLDYIAPQIYWQIGLEVADYQVLAPWWADVVRETTVSLYIGQAMYKHTSGVFSDPNELARHLDLNREHPEIQGDAYFSAVSVRGDADGAFTRLAKRHYAHPAIIPTMPHLGGEAPATPTGLGVRSTGSGARVRFNRLPHSGATSFAIYRVSGPRFDPAELASGTALLATVRANENAVRQEVTVRGVKKGEFLAVSALDRLWNESAPSKPRRVS